MRQNRCGGGLREDLEYKFLLSNSSFLKKEEEPERGKLEAKKPEQGKTKTIIAHQ